MIPPKHFYMIRHGQSVANANRYMAGSYDSPLTDLGREQAFGTHDVFERLTIKPSAIIHSHLMRARVTAEIINQRLGLTMHEDPHVAEHFVGAWERRPWEDVRPLLDQDVDPPDGESHAEFRLRIKTALTRILNQHDTPPLVVCHGGVFRAMGDLYGQEWHHIHNCVLYEFTPAEGSAPWTVYRHDETGCYPVDLSIAPHTASA